MQDQERRRYFRINETLGLSIQFFDQDGAPVSSNSEFEPNTVELISENDSRIERLLSELIDHNPKVAELMSLLNQKIERLYSVAELDNKAFEHIAHRVQEVNISACGLGFSHERSLPEGSRVYVELSLHSEHVKVRSEGVVVSCERVEDDEQGYYCRVDFVGMSSVDQESLIQFVVQSQSAQLAARRAEAK